MNKMMNVRELPGTQASLVDEATENSVLGALLNAEGHPLDCREEIVDLLAFSGPQTFAVPMNQQIYAAFLDCLIGNFSTGPHGITSVLRKGGGLTDEIMERVYRLTGTAGGPVEAMHGARMLRDLYRRRVVSQAMAEGASLVRSGEHEAGVAIADAFGRVATAVEEGNSSSTRYEGDRLVEEGLGVILGLRQRELGISFGIPDLDERTTGMHPGHMTAIGARSGDGKTVIGQNVGRYAAKRLDIPTVFFSLEMSPGDLLQRSAAAELGIPFAAIRDNTLSGEQRERVIQFADEERMNRNYRIEHMPGATIGALYLKARAAARDMGAKLFIIDYAQSVQSDRPIDKMDMRMAETVDGANNIASTLGGHVVLLSQLKKPQQGAEERAPGVNDLLYGTRIENVATTIILIQRLLENGKPGAEATAHTVKNRNGTLGEDDLIFDGARMRFLPPGVRMTGGGSW